jgi:hypothetical protein
MGKIAHNGRYSISPRKQPMTDRFRNSGPKVPLLAGPCLSAIGCARPEADVRVVEVPMAGIRVERPYIVDWIEAYYNRGAFIPQSGIARRSNARSCFRLSKLPYIETRQGQFNFAELYRRLAE